MSDNLLCLSYCAVRLGLSLNPNGMGIFSRTNCSTFENPFRRLSKYKSDVYAENVLAYYVMFILFVGNFNSF